PGRCIFRPSWQAVRVVPDPAAAVVAEAASWPGSGKYPAPFPRNIVRSADWQRPAGQWDADYPRSKPAPALRARWQFPVHPVRVNRWIFQAGSAIPVGRRMKLSAGLLTIDRWKPSSAGAPADRKA